MVPGNVVHTMLVLGITEIEGGVTLLERSGLSKGLLKIYDFVVL